MDVDVGEDELLVTLHEIMNECVTFFYLVLLYLVHRKRKRSNALHRLPRAKYNIISKLPKQLEHLEDIVDLEDEACTDYLRMDRVAFHQLCEMLQQFGGLRTNQNVIVTEQLAMFLVIITHHAKIRIIKCEYKRSGRTVGKYFFKVLNAIIIINKMFLVNPVPVREDCTDERWKFFKGCLGALNSTHIPIRVEKAERGCYRNCKGEISVNVLEVCNHDLNFIYVLTGWEKSAANSRVLRDAVNRLNGLKIPSGNKKNYNLNSFFHENCYYLCDNGYTNGPGFLTPFRGRRYHLDNWGRRRRAPQNKEEYFNMKHSKARNVIERAFGLLKIHWAILRSASYYPIQVHNRIIMACFCLHNYNRTTMAEDPLEHELANMQFMHNDNEDLDAVDGVKPTPEWTTWRDNLAISMFDT